MHTESALMNTVSPRAWRTVDFVVAAVLGVAAGVLFSAWNALYAPLSVPIGAVTPGLVALLNGTWLIGGLLVALVIRKPGAAVFGEVLAALVSAAVGNQWGWLVLFLGLAQGLAIEAGFAMWRYRRSGFIVVATAGVLGGVVQGVLEVLYWYPGADTLFSTIYISSSTLSGAILGAGSAFVLVRVLSKTGILTAFGR